MKKTYNFEKVEETKNLMISDLTEMLVGEKVVNSKYGEGEIIEVVKVYRQPLDKIEDVQVNIKFKEKTALFNLIRSYELNSITVSENAKNILLEYKTLLNTLFKTEDRLHNEELQRKRLEREENLKLERLKAKREAQKESLIRHTTVLDHMRVIVNDNYFTGLGYIAKHIKSLKVVLPDFIDEWFTSNFGNAERTVIDTSETTSGGYLKQWNLSMTITLDSNKNMPTALVEHLTSQNKKVKHIADTDYIFGLLRDYNFEVGKKQDVDKIREAIPFSHLKNFELGYNA